MKKVNTAGDKWKDIVGFPDYKVSKTGVVIHKETGKKLAQHYLHWNENLYYLRVNIKDKNGATSLKYISRLMFESFNNDIWDPAKMVRFVDGNPINLKLRNLTQESLVN